MQSPARQPLESGFRARLSSRSSSVVVVGDQSGRVPSKPRETPIRGILRPGSASCNCSSQCGQRWVRGFRQVRRVWQQTGKSHEIHSEQVARILLPTVNPQAERSKTAESAQPTSSNARGYAMRPGENGGPILAPNPQFLRNEISA